MRHAPLTPSIYMALDGQYTEGEQAMNLATVTFQGFNGAVVEETYGNGRRSLRIAGAVGPIARCTINLHDKEMEGDEVAIKDYGENEGMLDALVEAGIVMEPHRYIMIMTGGGPDLIPICRICRLS